MTNFSLHLFVCFFWEITIINSWRASNKLLVENLLASTSAHYAVLQTENNMKSISTINAVITENTDGTIVKAHAPVIDTKVGVSP